MKQNTAQHTPGPWQLYHLPFMDSDNGIDLKGNNGNTLIANFPTLEKVEGIAYTPSEEDAANLRLIAAAPELLESEQQFVQLCNNLAAALTEEQVSESIRALTAHCHTARAAIAAATGADNQ